MDLGLAGAGAGSSEGFARFLAQRLAEQEFAQRQQEFQLRQQELEQRNREIADAKHEAQQTRQQALNLRQLQSLSPGTELSPDTYARLTNNDTGAALPEQFQKIQGTPASLPSTSMAGFVPLGGGGAANISQTISQAIPDKYKFGGTFEQISTRDKENAAETARQEGLRVQEANQRRQEAAQQETARHNLAIEGIERDKANKANQGPDQTKLEKDYRAVLRGAMSNRSGALGIEDQKVQQANHSLGMIDQFYNPKTGGWDIPRVQLNELALSLAQLTAPRGTAGEQMMKEFQQRTAAGDLAGAVTYITGKPVAANTNAITAMLKESIERQGKIAEQNREGEMKYLRGLVPTELEQSRRDALEANTLNPLRQSRVIQNNQTGERKIQVSTDGGKSWQ